MQQVNVRIKRVDPRAILPRIAKPGDVCADLHALDKGTVPARGRAFIRTGIALELPEGYRARIHSRSGLSCNGILAAPGVIDNGYRGEVGIVLFNHGETAFRYSAGDRVAQLAIERYWEPVFVEVESLSETERGVMGFGSSGLGVVSIPGFPQDRIAVIDPSKREVLGVVKNIDALPPGDPRKGQVF